MTARQGEGVFLVGIATSCIGSGPNEASDLPKQAYFGINSHGHFCRDGITFVLKVESS